MAAQPWIRTPKGYAAITLAVYLLIAAIGSQNIGGVRNGAVAVFVSVLADIICCMIEKRKRIVPDGAVITGLIISLILSTTTPWKIVAVTAILSILSKHLLVHSKKPVFNPAAFGLLLSIVFFRSEQSWWGAFGDLPAWTIGFLLIGGYMATNRVNKFPQVFSFLGTFLLLLLLMGSLNIGNAADALRPPFINAALFFAFFMLTDPPTSPSTVKDQVFFGIIVALVGAAVYGFFGGLMYLFIGLVSGNLYRVFQARSSLNTSRRRSMEA